MNIVNNIKQIGVKNAVYLTEFFMSGIIMSSTAIVILVSTIPSLLGVSMLCLTIWSAIFFFVQE